MGAGKNITFYPPKREEIRIVRKNLERWLEALFANPSLWKRLTYRLVPEIWTFRVCKVMDVAKVMADAGIPWAQGKLVLAPVIELANIERLN
jgi:hypothetical protein